MNNLHQLFVHQIKDLYSAENQLLKAFPEMIGAAQSDELRQALEMHREETLVHVDRLTEIAQEMKIDLAGAFCAGMEGLIKEAKSTIKEVGGMDVMDAAIIASAQRIEHYEIAGYGTVESMAKEMEHTEAADRLGKTLAEEKKADKKLSQLAEGGWFSSGLNEVAEKAHVA